MFLKRYTVYMHITPNGKRYVGITSLEPVKRWCNGMGYKTQPLFFRAITKYGWHNIEHKVLYTDLTKERAIEIEIQLIAEYDSTNPQNGYNCTIGGEGANGVRLSEVTRKKISESHKGEKAVWYGKHLPEEMRKQISEKVKCLWDDEEYRQRHVEASTGKKQSDEAKRKKGDASRRAWQNEEYRRAHIEVLKRSWDDEEIRSKRIASITQTWKSKELAEQRSKDYSGAGNPFFGRKHTEETRQLLAELSRGKCGALHPGSKPVLQFDKDGNFIKRYESGRIAAIDNQIFPANLNKCLRGVTKSAGGFIWEYEQKEAVE